MNNGEGWTLECSEVNWKNDVKWITGLTKEKMDKLLIQEQEEMG